MFLHAGTVYAFPSMGKNRIKREAGRLHRRRGELVRVPMGRFLGFLRKGLFPFIVFG